MAEICEVSLEHGEAFDGMLLGQDSMKRVSFVPVILKFVAKSGQSDRQRDRQE
jgi:hypothetical protein